MKKKILVLDDEPDTLTVTELWLTLQGFAVTTAGDGEAGLQAFERDRPDLVVTDYMMPGIGGIEFCRRLRALEGEVRTPVVMASAAASPPKNPEQLYDVFMTKPVSFDRLLGEIRRLLDR